MSSLWSDNSPTLIIGAASLWTTVITCLFPGSQLPLVAWQARRCWGDRLQARHCPSWPPALPFQLGQPGLSRELGAMGQLSRFFLLPAVPRVCSMREPTLLAALQPALFPASRWLPSQAPRSAAAPAACPGSGWPSHNCHPLVSGRNSIVNK